MKKNLLFSLMMLAAGTVLAADPKDDVAKAATALGNEQNYSWRTTVDAGANARFKPGPTEGKTEKDGSTMLSMSFNDNTTQVIIQGKKVALKTQDGGWQSAEEAMQDNGGGGFNPTAMYARMAQTYRTPAVDAATVVGLATNLIAGTNGITGDLTEDGAKTMLTLFRRGNNGNGPTASNAKGSVTFWLTDGKLTKFQTHVSGTVTFNGNDREMERTTVTEIKDVGTTKIEVPDDAKKKLE